MDEQTGDADQPKDAWAVSQVEIARRLGISQVTVHRALADKKDVSKATREAVLRLATHLNYRRNASATSLRGSSFGAIGFLARRPMDGMGRTLSRIVTHCSDALRERGLNLVLSLPPDDASDEHLPRLLTHLCVDGLIVAGPIDPKIEKAVAAAGPPVAWIDHRPAGSAGVFSIDECAAARTVTAHLLRLGRGVVYVGRETVADPHYSAIQRQEGYRQAMMAASLPAVELICPRGKEPEFIRSYLSTQRQPVALLCYNHVFAHQTLAQVTDLGLSSPRDVALACCDDEWIVALMEVTTMAYDERALSQQAISWLCQEGAARDSTPPAPLARTLEIRRSSSP